MLKAKFVFHYLHYDEHDCLWLPWTQKSTGPWKTGMGQPGTNIRFTFAVLSELARISTIGYITIIILHIKFSSLNLSPSFWVLIKLKNIAVNYYFNHQHDNISFVYTFFSISIRVNEFLIFFALGVSSWRVTSNWKQDRSEIWDMKA